MKISQPPPPNPMPLSHHRVTQVDAPAPINKDKPEPPAAPPFVDRRKPNSDRRTHSAARGPFNMRNGRDRRKNSGFHIEEDA